MSIALMRVATVLPPRERYAPGEAGAIGLLAARLARESDCICGVQPEGAVFPRGRFRKVVRSHLGFSGAHRYARGCLAVLHDEKPDLIEVHNRPEIARWLARGMPKTPIVLVLHNDPCGMRSARTASERQRLVSEMQVVAVSAWVKERFLDGIVSLKADILVQPNCIELADLPDAAIKRVPEILFVGRVVADKGADAFVRACAAVLPQWPGWRARMIGGDRFGALDHRTPFLESLTREAALSGVTMDGYRPHESVMESMARAAIVIVPSRWPEPFGLTALEAMASGAAVIVSPNGALPDVVGDAALFADPDVPGALEGAIERLLENEALRSALAEKGLLRAALFDAKEARVRLDRLRRDVIEAVDVQS